MSAAGGVHIDQGPCLALSCPLCPFVTVEVHRLRKHAVAEHLRGGGGGGGGGSFNYKLYVCGECAACSTDVDIVRDHAAVSHRDSRGRRRLLLNEVCLTAPPAGCGSNGTTPPADDADADDHLPPDDSNPGRLVCKASEGKYTCTACHCSFPRAAEAAFHAAARHLASAEVEADLSRLGRLSEAVRARISRMLTAAGGCFGAESDPPAAADVEAALFATIDAHLRLQCSTGDLVCSDCGQRFGITQLPEAVAHINDTVRRRLPEFMTSAPAGGGPQCRWSLHRQEEWVWVVPDTPAPAAGNPPSPCEPPPPPAAEPTGSPAAEAALSADADASSNDASSATAAAAAAAAANVAGASRRKKLPVRYVPPRPIHHGHPPTTSSPPQPPPPPLPSTHGLEATLRSGGWQVVAIDDDLYACSHCPEVMAARPEEVRLHVVSEHLGLPSLACPYCDACASCEPDAVLEHCRAAHPDRTPQFVPSAAHRTLSLLVPAPDCADGDADVDTPRETATSPDEEELDGDDAIMNDVDDEDALEDEVGDLADAAAIDEDADDEDADVDVPDDDETAAAVAALGAATPTDAAVLMMDGDGDCDES